MKAAIYENYGPPEVVKIVEAPRPEPRKNEILIKVIATTVNRNDCALRRPDYAWIIRPLHGLFRPRTRVLGTEFSGVVTEVGANVRTVKVGDELFGLTGDRFGCHAEYLVVPESGAFAPKPKGVPHEKAVSILDGPWLAHAIVRSFDDLPTEPPLRVLVYGASGSIGSACVEFLRARGKTHVTAVSQSLHLERVRALGADQTFSVEERAWREPALPPVSPYDGIIDAVGKLKVTEHRHLLKREGRFISTDFGPGNEMLWWSLASALGARPKASIVVPALKKETLETIRQMTEKAQLIPLVDREYAFDQIVEAHRYVDQEAKFGSVVIRVG